MTNKQTDSRSLQKTKKNNTNNNNNNKTHLVFKSLK